jgi:hypothetical protein
MGPFKKKNGSHRLSGDAAHGVFAHEKHYARMINSFHVVMNCCFVDGCVEQCERIIYSITGKCSDIQMYLQSSDKCLPLSIVVTH